MHIRRKHRPLVQKRIHRITARPTTHVSPATALPIHAHVVVVRTALVPAHRPIRTTRPTHQPARNACLPPVAALLPCACLLVLATALAVVGEASLLPEAAARRIQRKASGATRLGAACTGKLAGGDDGDGRTGGSSRAADAAEAEGPPAGAGDANDFGGDDAGHSDHFATITRAGVVGE